MKNEDKLSAKSAFHGAKGHIDANKDEIAFTEFQNRLRQGRTDDWTYEHGQTTIKYKDGYLHDIERELFNLLNERDGKGSGIHCG